MNRLWGVGEHGVDLPLAIVRPVDPEFVLHGIAARDVVFVAKLERLGFQSSRLGDHFTRRANLVGYEDLSNEPVIDWDEGALRTTRDPA